MASTYLDSAETQYMLAAAAQGDADCVDLLFQRHLSAVKASIRRRLRPETQARFDASDVLQETQQQAIQNLPDFLQRRPMPFRLWLLKTAHHRLVDLERFHLQAAKRTAHREVLLPDASSMDLARILFADRPTPIEEVELQEQATIVRRCIAELKEEDREVLMLRIFDDLSNSEVALVLDQNPETTKKRFARALLRMKRLLRSAGMGGAQP